MDWLVAVVANSKVVVDALVAAVVPEIDVTLHIMEDGFQVSEHPRTNEFAKVFQRHGAHRFPSFYMY
jgi:hypothetical protein